MRKPSLNPIGKPVKDNVLKVALAKSRLQSFPFCAYFSVCFIGYSLVEILLVEGWDILDLNYSVDLRHGIDSSIQLLHFMEQILFGLFTIIFVLLFEVVMP